MCLTVKLHRFVASGGRKRRQTHLAVVVAAAAAAAVVTAKMSGGAYRFTQASIFVYVLSSCRRRNLSYLTPCYTRQAQPIMCRVCCTVYVQKYNRVDTGSRMLLPSVMSL